MLSKRTTKRMRDAIDFILAEPRRFNMRYAVEPVAGGQFGILKEQLDTPPCGTACCFGGAVYLLGKRIKTMRRRSFEWDDVRPFATQYLGINEDQADRLFHTSNWPTHFREAYDNATTAIERAYVGAARFEHFIATDGKE